MATDYSKYNQSQYDNQSKYLDNLINNGTAGQKAWAEAEKNSLNSQYKPQAQPTQPAVTNTTNNNNVNSVNNNAFIAPGSQVAEDGTRFQSWGENGEYKKKDYLSGNADLQYALQQYMDRNNTNVYDVGGLVKEMYGNIGSQRDNGSTVTVADIDKELERLGLSDYNSQNVIHTAGNDFIPLNQYTQFKNGSLGGSNSPDSEWVSYAGQDYLIGGSNADFVNYVNAITGNMTGADLLFDDMLNNPYAKENADFAQWYQNMLNQFNGTAGVQTPTAPTASTGYGKVDQLI
ncbi:MAG: hypothetical protein IIV02_04030, partial [Peptococcaceae bacterium]|nr:hypothetical protein [Peptococcaceae bacterium]